MRSSNPNLPIGDKALEYAKELWTIGNVVAGFCILQTVVFLVEAGRFCSTLGIAVAKYPLSAYAFIGLFGVGYVVLISLSYLGQRRIFRGFRDNSEVVLISRCAAWIRTVI